PASRSQTPPGPETLAPWPGAAGRRPAPALSGGPGSNNTGRRPNAGPTLGYRDGRDPVPGPTPPGIATRPALDSPGPTTPGPPGSGTAGQTRRPGGALGLAAPPGR